MWGAAAILAVTALAMWQAPPLPLTLDGLRTAGPYAVLLIALGLAWWFNRGRSFVIVASLLLGWAGYHYAVGHSAATVETIYLALVVLIPLNSLLVLVLRERGARYRAAYPWLALLAAEVLLVLWLGTAAKGSDVFEHWALRSPPTPLVGRLMFAAAFAAAVWRAYPGHTPLQVGNAGALVAFFIAAEWAGARDIFAAFMAAAGAILIAALLQESHRLAFRDALTGLPGRRALEERLRSLPARYAIAMVDVDHFKKFNDTHGHDTGDQVLRLVAGRLAEVGGGGIAYRYGGEEFSVLFPDSEPGEAAAHLEAIRAAIEGYRMALRGQDRPKKPEEAAKLRGSKPAEKTSERKTLSVTVSIGVAGPSEALRTPAQVIKAADQALYRAKRAGRNRLAR